MGAVMCFSRRFSDPFISLLTPPVGFAFYALESFSTITE
jgi:hypothetical protein